MTSSVTARRVAESSARSSCSLKSSGGPAFTQIGRPKWTPLWPRRHTGPEPHTATGITGTPVASDSRATPVFPRVGEKSGLEVTVDSGYTTTSSP
jgi:hypothetical protein